MGGARWWGLGAIACLVLAVFAASQLLGIGTGDAGSPEPPVGTTEYTVEHVHDGDTLFVRADDGSDIKVRLIGVDTPELEGSEPAECFAAEARDDLRRLLPDGSSVRALAGVDRIDPYGRALLYLWNSDGDFVNLELVREGAAEAVRIGANDAYWPELSAAEAKAREARAGRWGACTQPGSASG
ncbi:thermonuclease family protein [Ruicaihuangia caeni]|uniref:Thermonuclease family protein n=1 Tax=Ruicaihuangia caeni TaxID=3042517 RepID=A0AAW6T492_9MICO|nr:thermonuclease family protein [Klugiella sp. YN-L-19]MDI2098512.1 thermonuclease family protein [Klugiella sp. YN-L-19]